MRKKYVLYLAMFLALFLTAAVPLFATNYFSADEPSYTAEEQRALLLELFDSVVSTDAPIVDLSDEWVSLEQFMKNQHSSLLTINSIINESYSRGHGGLRFPDYMGGAYLDINGNLVLLVVDSFRIMDTPSANIALSDNVSVRFVEHSYKYLHHLFTDILERVNYIERDGDVISYLVSFSLNEEENSLEIILDSINDENIEHFRRTISNSPALRFTTYEEIYLRDLEWERRSTEIARAEETLLGNYHSSFDYATTDSRSDTIFIYPGTTAIVGPNTPTTEPGSIAFPVTCNSVPRPNFRHCGFVTARHVLLPSANQGSRVSRVTFAPFNSTRIGEVTRSVRSHDVAFVSMDRNVVPTNVLPFCRRQLTFDHAPSLQNSTVITVGATSRRNISARVTSTSASVTIDGARVSVARTRFDDSSVLTRDGDSGGIVFQPIDFFDRAAWVAGIHVAINTFGFNNGYFVMSRCAVDALNVRLGH